MAITSLNEVQNCSYDESSKDKVYTRELMLIAGSVLGKTAEYTGYQLSTRSIDLTSPHKDSRSKVDPIDINVVNQDTTVMQQPSMVSCEAAVEKGLPPPPMKAPTLPPVLQNLALGSEHFGQACEASGPPPPPMEPPSLVPTSSADSMPPSWEAADTAPAEPAPPAWNVGDASEKKNQPSLQLSLCESLPPPSPVSIAPCAPWHTPMQSPTSALPSFDAYAPMTPPSWSPMHMNSPLAMSSCWGMGYHGYFYDQVGASFENAFPVTDALPIFKEVKEFVASTSAGSEQESTPGLSADEAALQSSDSDADGSERRTKVAGSPQTVLPAVSRPPPGLEPITDAASEEAAPCIDKVPVRPIRLDCLL